MARPRIINILINNIAGLGPSTLSLAVPDTITAAELRQRLDERLPCACNTGVYDFQLSTLASNRHLSSKSPRPLSDFCSSFENPENVFLTLRLSLPLPGGKGGFGSQLRAAGGRMSSKRKKGSAADLNANGSSRNLDGRRLRTVTEAKALAEYLAIKPEMDRKEKEARRMRWEEIVEQTERKAEEIRSGGSKASTLDGKWAEEKEVAGERTREAVLTAMKGAYTDNLGALGTSSGSNLAESADAEQEDDEMDRDEDKHEGSSSKATTPSSDPENKIGIKRTVKAKKGVGKGKARSFFGFDEDEFMSSSDEG